MPPIPGARAGAMGGAGIALVDDAAAARANPARLAAIPAATLGIDLGFGSADDSRLDESEPLDPALNPVARIDVRSEGSTDLPLDVGFLGYAHPLRLLGRPLVVAASRTQVLDVSAGASSLTRTTPLAALPTPGAGDEVVRIGVSDLDVNAEAWSAAAGWRLTPTFGAGAALELGRLDLESSSAGYLSDPLQFTGPGMSDPTFGTSTPELLLASRSRGSDTSIGYAFGAWWKPHPSLSLASVYRSGYRFEVEGTTFRTPDAAAVGLAWAPFHRRGTGMARTLMVALDLERVEYGDLMSRFQSGRGIQTSGQFGGTARFAIDDAIEARAGIEASRSFPGWSLALRGGLYTEHEARPGLVSFTGDTAALAGQSAALARSGYLAPGETELHLTLGAGVRLYALAFDVALDLSDPAARVIASATWRRR